VRYLETMIDVLVDGGAFRGAVFSARDVTDRIEERQRLEREVAFRGALVEVTNELLAASLDERFYQHALERTVALVPDAQGGSMLLLRADGSFGFEAAVEFDLDVLRSITLTGAELGRRDPPRVERLAVREYDGRLSDAKYRRFASAGRLDDIQVTLSVPMVVAGGVHGYLNLDNFEREDAFDHDDVAIAEAIAAQVSVALQRRMLEHDLQAERARYEQMASHDALTELPNRRLFQDRLQQALARARRRDRRVGVLFIDLDGFKQVNDRHGHDAGDAVLKAIGTLLANGVRAEDTVARLGGDEFGVLLADVNDAEDAASVGGKLLVALSTPVVRGGHRGAAGRERGRRRVPGSRDRPRRRHAGGRRRDVPRQGRRQGRGAHRRRRGRRRSAAGAIDLTGTGLEHPTAPPEQGDARARAGGRRGRVGRGRVGLGGGRGAVRR
jgi:GGDEF domain-containing protein